MKERDPKELRRESPERVVRTYFSRWDAHDAEGMIALLDDGVVFRLGESGWSGFREGVLVGRAWEVAAGVRVDVVELETDGDVVRTVSEKRTRIDDLLGVGPDPDRREFTVRGGIIRNMIVETGGFERLAYLVDRRAKLEPVIEWMESEHPSDVGWLFFEGRIDPYGTSLAERRRKARLLVDLLEEYRVWDWG